MNRLDLTNLGGLPFTQDRLDFLEEGHLDAFGAIARLCGDKVILYGVELVGGNVSDGWIAYNGELIRFVGGAVAAQVVITDTPVPFNFGDATIHDVQFTKTATCGLVGAFDFTDLVPLLTLQNTWRAGDLRQCMMDAVDEALNFDAGGYGVTVAYKGWRKLSSVYVDAAGAMLVNKKDGDADFGVVGDNGGSKTKTIAQNNLPDSMTFGMPLVPHTSSGAPKGVTDGPSSAGSTNITISNVGGSQPMNVLNPFFVVLTLIKL
jgi:hypothetical protein